MIQIYTGDGKGKTTAALGLITRALGRKLKVCLIQFMKKNYSYGEIVFLSKQQGLDIFQFGTDKLIDPENPASIDYSEAAAALKKGYEIISGNKYDLVILDEINVAVKWGLISVEDQLQIFQMAGDTEVVMTGRYARKEVIDKADLVTDMRAVKHYYNAGIKARPGIEY